MSTTLTISRPGLGWLAGGLAIGLLAAAFAGPGVGAALAQSDADETIRSIKVNGIGRVKVQPDVADIQLGVTKQGEDAKQASERAATTMDAVIQALLDAGIAEADIQTANLSLNPIYDWDDNPPNIVGWEATNIVNITVRDVSQVGDVVDAATAAGATNVNGITFRLEDSTEAEATARNEAVANAEAKAQQLAAAAGVNIIAVVTIDEVDAQEPPPIFFSRAEAAFDTAAAAPTPVLPGEVEISVNVNIQYEIE